MLGAVMFTADPDADVEYSLTEWRRWRKRRRLADIEWIDALYYADLSAIGGAAAFYALAAVIGDGRLTPAQVADVTAHGDAWLALVAALVLAVGLRSGCRGGPLVMEQADVRHVLLAPVDRGRALRGPLLRQLRFMVFVGAVVGLAVGHLAARRLPGHAAGWMASGTVYAVAVVALGFGAALVASTSRMPSWLGSLLGFGLVGVALADVVGVIPGSPMAAWGRIGLWPVQPVAPGLLALAVSATLLVVGLLRAGHVSIEAAERRSTLVGQLRFAATLQDVRTVVVLRRQLALELPRLRPWVRLRVRGVDRFPVWSRGLRGVLRWPAARVGRLVLLGVLAGLALRGVWEGTTPLLVLAGLALFVAGLDAAEAMCQEVDHPTLSDSVPVPLTSLQARHLAVAVAVMAVVALVGAGVAVVVEPSVTGLALALVCAPAAALGGVAAAGVSLLAIPDPVEGLLMPPEVTGALQALRVARPFLLATAGTLPVLAGRAAFEAGRPPVAAAGAAAGAVGVLFALFVAWVWQREKLAAATRAVVNAPGGHHDQVR